MDMFIHKDDDVLSAITSMSIVRLIPSMSVKSIDSFIRVTKEIRSPQKALSALIRITCDIIPSNNLLDYLIMKLKVYPMDNNGYFYKRLSQEPQGKNIAAIMKSLTRVYPEIEPLYITDETELEYTSNLYPVYYMYDPIDAIKKGFMPEAKVTETAAFGRWVLGEPLNQIALWNPDWDIDTPKYLKTSCPYWVYRTEEELITYAEQTANTIPLIFIRPDLIYKSNRPHTTMDSFVMGPTISKEDLIDTGMDFPYSIGCSIDKSDYYLLPVTRYGEGMGKGLYNKPTEKSYCGTFYYYEPESNVYLAFNTSIVGFNKISLAEKLNLYFNNEDDKEKYDILRDHANGVLPSNLILSPYAAGLVSNEKTKGYAAEVLGLYGVEDFLDQMLCTTNRDLGNDLVILTNMIGSYQVVCEILDTRNRRDSYLHLIRVE